MPSHVDRLSRQNNGLQRHEFYKRGSVSKDSMEVCFLLSPLWRQHVLKTMSISSSHSSRCFSFLNLYLWTLTPVLQSWLKSVFWKIIFLTFTSFLSSFHWDLKFHYLGAILTEYSAGQVTAASFVLSVHLALLGLLPFPQAQRAFIGCVAGAEELAPEVLCFLTNMLLESFWKCPNKGRRARPV